MINNKTIQFLNKYVLENLVPYMRNHSKLPLNSIPNEEWDTYRQNAKWFEKDYVLQMRKIIINLFSQDLDYSTLFTEYKSLLPLLFPGLPYEFMGEQYSDYNYISLQNNQYHTSSILLHSLNATCQYKGKDWLLRLSILLHDLGKLVVKTTDENGHDHFYEHPTYSAKFIEEICSYGIFTEKESAILYSLVMNHDQMIPTSKKDFKSVYNNLYAGILKYEKENLSINVSNIFLPEEKIKILDKWWILKKCDIFAHALLNSRNLIEKVYNADDIYSDSRRKILKDILLSDMPISGQDILTLLEIKKGPEVGYILKQVAKAYYKICAEKQSKATRDEMLYFLSESQYERAKIYANIVPKTKVFIENGYLIVHPQGLPLRRLWCNHLSQYEGQVIYSS